MRRNTRSPVALASGTVFITTCMCSYRYACVNFKVSLCLHKFNFSNLPLSHASTLPHEHKTMSCFSFICQQSGLGSAQKLGLPGVRNVQSIHILLNICVSQATHFNYHYAICSRVMTNIKIRVHLNHWQCQHVNMNVIYLEELHSS